MFAVIRKILQQAGFNRIRMMRCARPTEWETTKTYRQKYFFDKVPITDPYTWTFDRADHAHFVLYQGMDIIGYAHIQLWPERRAALRIIVIDEVKRGQGLGQQFLAFIEKWLKTKNYKSLYTESSPEALQFYKKQGYIEMPFNDPETHETHPLDTPLGKML